MPHQNRKKHVLQIEERFWRDIVKGRKTFEVRSLKHGIEVGDLIEFDPIGEDGLPLSVAKRLGAPQIYEVTYALEGYGIEDGHAVYSIVRYIPPQYLATGNAFQDFLESAVKPARDPRPVRRQALDEIFEGAAQ